MSWTTESYGHSLRQSLSSGALRATLDADGATLTGTVITANALDCGSDRCQVDGVAEVSVLSDASFIPSHTFVSWQVELEWDSVRGWLVSSASFATER